MDFAAPNFETSLFLALRGRRMRYGFRHVNMRQGFRMVLRGIRTVDKGMKQCYCLLMCPIVGRQIGVVEI